MSCFWVLDGSKHHPSNQLQLHILVQLHVLGVDAQHLQAANLVRDTNVNLAVEAPESPQSSINTASENCA